MNRYIQSARHSKDPMQQMLAESWLAYGLEERGLHHQVLARRLRALAITRTLPLAIQPDYLTSQLSELARTYRKLRQWQSAGQALKEARYWETKYHSVATQAVIYTEMACLNADRGHQQAALQTGERAVTLARRSSRPDIVRMALDSLFRIQQRYGQFEAALHTAQETHHLTDSLASVAKVQAIATIETRYKVAAKETTIKTLRTDVTIQRLRTEARQRALATSEQRQLVLRWLTIILAAILALVVFLLWRSRQLQRQTEQQRVLLDEQTSELQHLSREKDKLFAIVSHDLRVPGVQLMQVINQNLQLAPPPEAVPGLLITLQKQVGNFNQLVDNLLYWSLNQRGHLRIIPERLFLDELVAEAIERFTADLTRKKLSVMNQVKHELVTTDENLMGLVLRNLLHNAIKFTPVNGTITLCSERCANWLDLVIQDSGPGFTATQQADAGAPDTPGTGLGLVVSDELMQACGGKLLVQEMEPHGTEVYLSWPV